MEEKIEKIKPLRDWNEVEVERLLERLNLSNYRAIFKQNEVDGLTLYNCHSTEDVKELGIKYKTSGVHSKQLSSYKYSTRRMLTTSWMDEAT